jgi:outer membrane protein OmpA-like peptidoglycan-associated protein
MTMQRHQDTNGSGRWLGLLGVSALALLSGCDWIFGGSTPIGPPPRPGAEKAVQPSASIPAAPANPQYDAGVVPGDERAPAIGSIVSGKGGQKAQRDAIEKEQADRDRKDREERLEREAADKADKAKEKQQEGTTPVAAPVGAPPAGAGTITSDQPPVSAPVPPPAPVTAAPMAPPSASPDPATTPPPLPVPAAPTPSGNPNRAFTPPPGWTPPGTEPGSVTTGTPPAATPEPAPASPTPPADPNKAFAPQPGWVPPGVNVASVMTLAPLTVSVMGAADDSCADPMPAKGIIATAQSGEVPFSTLTSPPFDGSLQVATIQFGRGSTGLDGIDAAVLARVVDIQRENGGTVRIVAHAAQDRDNLEVSRRRALAVAQELRRLGVPTSQIVAEAASDDEPIYQTSTARGLAANRRADVFIDF